MARRKPMAKRKITRKEIITFLIVSVLVIAALVILTTDNKLNNYVLDFLDKLEKTQSAGVVNPPSSNGDGKIYTSILSGKGNITLPSEFDTGILLEVHFIDIGQGDAIVINFPDRKTMLIDSGTSSPGQSGFREKYLQYLDDATDNKVIEYMIVTHPDSDHYNMLASVVESYEVKSAYYNQDLGASYTQFVSLLTLEPGIMLYEIDKQSVTYIIEGDGYKVTVFCCGDSAFSGGDEKNNQSLICLVEFGGRRILFTGDAGISTEEWFISEVGKPYIDVDVLKVGHHGSNTSTGATFLEFIDAEYAVISCDDGTLYNHPNPVVMERLSLYGIVTYRTNRHGNILLYIDGDGDFGFLTEKDTLPENNSANIDERKIAIVR